MNAPGRPRIPGNEPLDYAEGAEPEARVYPIPEGRTWNWDFRFDWGGYRRDSEDCHIRSAHVDDVLKNRNGDRGAHKPRGGGSNPSGGTKRLLAPPTPEARSTVTHGKPVSAPEALRHLAERRRQAAQILYSGPSMHLGRREMTSSGPYYMYGLSVRSGRPPRPRQRAGEADSGGDGSGDCAGGHLVIFTR